MKLDSWDDAIPGDLVSWKSRLSTSVISDQGVGIVLSVINAVPVHAVVLDVKKLKLRKFYTHDSAVYHVRGLHVSLLWREEHD